MITIPASEITMDQLEELNILYNGNTTMTESERSIWKAQLIEAGYVWNDLDGWGYWSIPGNLARRLRGTVSVCRPIIKKRSTRRLPLVSMYAQTDLFDPIPPLATQVKHSPRCYVISRST